MTFSIVARCPRTGQFGVAAATAVPAVGKLVTHAYPRAGAVATQARLNPYLGIDGIAMLREGLGARQTLERLTLSDPRVQARQFAVVDNQGRCAAFTGSQNLDWAGAVEHEGYCVQGNRLVGPQVLHAAARAFDEGVAEPLSRRFLAALEAGAGAGGDRKGERSATIYIVDTEEYPLWDIRVDDDEDPIGELHRLHEVFARELLPEIARMPTRGHPAGATDEWSV